MTNPRLLTMKEIYDAHEVGETFNLSAELKNLKAQDAKTLKAVARLLKPHIINEELEGLHALLVKEGADNAVDHN